MELKNVDELFDEFKIPICSNCEWSDIQEDVVKVIQAAQKNAIEVAISRAKEEFKVVEKEFVSTIPNEPFGTYLKHVIDDMSVRNCKDVLLIQVD